MKAFIYLAFVFSVLFCNSIAQDIKAELQQTVQQQGIAQDLENSPDGTAMRLLPDGGFQIFAAGTGSYDSEDVDDVLDAQREATIKAKANLAKFLNENLSTDEKIEELSKKVKTVSSVADETSSRVDMEKSKTALLSIRSSANALLKGVITISSAKIPGKGQSGIYRVMVGVSSKTLTTVAKMTDGMQVIQTVPAANPAGDATGQTYDLEGTTEENETQAFSNQSQEGWIECVGKGAERQLAITAALIEGVQQVYGVALQNDTKMSERMKKFKVDGKASRDSSKQSSSNTLTQTAGFIREYRIISVDTGADGLVDAVIHAQIVNPRAGGAVAVMLYKPSISLEKLTKSYEVGPNRRVSGSEISDLVGKTFNKAFANANVFLVLTIDDLASVLAQQQLAETMVSENLSPVQELVKAGQLLTADYILTSNIEDLKYSRTVGLNQTTRKFGPIYKMSIKMSYKLTDVTTGHAMLMEDIIENLANEEIAALLEEDAEADLLQALMTKVTLAINEKIQQK